MSIYNIPFSIFNSNLRVKLEKYVQECDALVHFDFNNLLNGYS